MDFDKMVKRSRKYRVFKMEHFRSIVLLVIFLFVGMFLIDYVISGMFSWYKFYVCFSCINLTIIIVYFSTDQMMHDNDRDIWFYRETFDLKKFKKEKIYGAKK